MSRLSRIPDSREYHVYQVTQGGTDLGLYDTQDEAVAAATAAPPIDMGDWTLDATVQRYGRSGTEYTTRAMWPLPEGETYAEHR